MYTILYSNRDKNKNTTIWPYILYTLHKKKKKKIKMFLLLFFVFFVFFILSFWEKILINLNKHELFFKQYVFVLVFIKTAY